MAHLFKYGFLLLLGLPAALLADSTGPTQLEVSRHDYTAVYHLLRNDKKMGKATISLTHQGDIWTLHGFTHDMRGLAKVLNIKGTQTSKGQWKDGRFLPDYYKIAFSLIGFKTGWAADFDWSAGIVTTTVKGKEKQLSLADGAIDPFSLSLNILALLTQGQTQITLNVIDEDMIDSEVYAAEPISSFDSTLGCLQTTRVERIRENKKRKSVVWYANDLDFVPVLIHHSKRKGNKLEFQIASLDIDEQKILPAAACANNTES